MPVVFRHTRTELLHRSYVLGATLIAWVCVGCVSSSQVVKYPVSAVHILKCHGLSLLDSTVEPGYALNCVRASQGMPTSVKNAKVACLDINLQRYKMQMGVQVG